MKSPARSKCNSTPGQNPGAATPLFASRHHCRVCPSSGNWSLATNQRVGAFWILPAVPSTLRNSTMARENPFLEARNKHPSSRNHPSMSPCKSWTFHQRIRIIPELIINQGVIATAAGSPTDPSSWRPHTAGPSLWPSPGSKNWEWETRTLLYYIYLVIYLLYLFVYLFIYGMVW